MNQLNFDINWHETISDEILDGFVQTGYLVIDDCFDLAFVKQLQIESGFIDYKEATLTHGERLTAIRGDSIRWIDENCQIGSQYLQAIEDLGKFFNQTLYAGIRRAEAHYARYPVGFGYDWHTDNPKGRDERVISAVFYLNDDWGEQDGGEIVLIDKQENTQKLLPKANRLIIFDSNLRHHVAKTGRERFSIATWLRNDD